MGWIEAGTAWAGERLAGVGVLVFLPQIVILFAFILVLEDSGYLPRAAYLLDRMMGGFGLSGRSFIPLLSSFACAIPGIAGAAAVAWVLKRFTTRGQVRTLMMELPAWHWPHLPNVLLGLWQRVRIFLRRVGGIILVLTIMIWFLAFYPAQPPAATGAAIQYSLAGMLGRGLEVIFAPIGFNWQISLALVPGMAAREVAVSALGTGYALSAAGDGTAEALVPLIASQWSLATALALLAWFVFAPQCLSTIATIRRETGSWRMPVAITGGLFALAYVAAGATYHAARALGGS
jgi:ferrous iron transport protein B